MDHIEETVERFVLGLAHNPETFRGKVEHQAEAMRRSLRSGESAARALRKELDVPDGRENNLVEAIASGTRLTGKLQEKLERIQEDREGVQARLKELSDVEEQARRLREIPRLVEEYLTDLPYLIDRMPMIRQHETIPAERTPDNPLGIYELTPDSIRS